LGTTALGEAAARHHHATAAAARAPAVGGRHQLPLKEKPVIARSAAQLGD